MYLSSKFATPQKGLKVFKMLMPAVYRIVQVQFAPLLDVRRHGGAEHGHVAAPVLVAALEDDGQLKEMNTWLTGIQSYHIGRIFAFWAIVSIGQLYENCRSSPYFWGNFIPRKMFNIDFDEKTGWATFCAIFHKLIWSRCLNIPLHRQNFALCI
jgi:hypothetical protein